RAARPQFVRLHLDALETRTLLTTFVVGTTADSGAGSLRNAITLVNGDADPSSVIQFKINTGVQTISPASPLPAITHPGVIDGTTQPGFAGTPLIVLDGSSAGASANGLRITAGNSTVKELVISDFGGAGISLETVGGNLIVGNYLGTDVTGSKGLGNGFGGLITGAKHNTVGGTAAGAGNLISGNIDGIRIQISGSGNLVQGNRIGTDATGTKALANTEVGVFILTSNNTVGGTAAGAGNTISGN